MAKRPSLSFAVGLAALLLSLWAAPGAPAAPPPLFWQTPEDGKGGTVGGQLRGGNGIGVDSTTGHLFVADNGNARIQELDPWGQFIKAWGWGVVASGPNDKPPVNERQQLKVTATSGTYKLRYFNAFGGGKSSVQSTAAIDFDASAAEVQAALEGLPSLDPGDVTVSGGPGDPGGIAPYEIEFTGTYVDTDIPQLSALEPVEPSLSGSAVVTTLQGGGSFEVCVASEGDVCREGQAGGTAPGQVPEPNGVAVDGAGDVYVHELVNGNLGEETSFRLQKFDSEGNFLWMAGGEVNKTKSTEGGSSEAERNLCTKAQLEGGDICGSGVPGSGKGQFAQTFVLGNRIAVGPSGTTFVGDIGRIQEFNPDGSFKGEVAVPGGETIRLLAVDSAGNFYLTYALNDATSKDNVRKLSPAGAEIAPSPFEAKNPWSLALDNAGSLYAIETRNRIVEFDATGKQLIGPGEEFGKAQNLSGLATSTACGIPAPGDLYASVNDGGDNFSLRAYGPPPQDLVNCPPPDLPPIVNEQFVASAGSDGAVVKAKINPVYHPDTRYFVQYGTGKCSEGGCEQTQPAPPGSKLTDQVVRSPLPTPGVFLSGLDPSTTYRYRFVAESIGGQTIGPEQSFKTLAKRPAPPSSDPCPNASFRSGPAAYLPDCRAYEMVSPVDKQNGDVIAFLTAGHERAAINQSSLDGERLAYSSYRSFGDAVSAPFTSAYMASRVGGEGWQSQGISPPRETPLFDPISLINSQFKAFSPDLCTSWLAHDADPPLAEGAPEGFVNLYRRENCGSEANSYQPLIGVEPPILASESFAPAIQAISADGAEVVLQVKDELAPGAVPCATPVGNEAEGCRQLYLSSGPGSLHTVCLLPSGRSGDTGCSAGTNAGVFEYEGREATVTNAISDDGSRIFWSDDSEGEGRIYARLNPTEPESAQELGSAIGTGDLIGPASGTGGTNGTKTISKVTGIFAVGQAISGSTLQAGTIVTAIEKIETDPEVFETKLKINKNTTATQPSVALTGAASATVSSALTSSGAFAVGQEILGKGIPIGTTILEVNGSNLLLSNLATQTATAADLDAFSKCTEADKACTVPVSSGPAQYWSAAADGSKALFTEGSLETGKAQLFEFDVASEAATPIAGQVFGLVGQSEDAERIYLVSAEALDGGASAGQPNLYLHEEGGGFTFIATLAKTDALQVGGAAYSPVNVRPSRHTAQTSPDGNHLTFMSKAPLTGADNTDVASGEADAEVFLFSVGEGLRCVSCNRTGARPVGRDIVAPGLSQHPFWAAGRIPTAQTQLYTSPRVLSQDGNRLIFESYQALLPADTNGKGDVYQWEAPGKGSCSEADPSFREDAGGCIALISSGEAAEHSAIVDVDEDGSDVFFATEESLLPQDPGLIDIYDARIEGGLPTPPVPEPFCEGEACQSPPAPPAEVTPASSAFKGPGNPKAQSPKPRRCPKGKRRVRRAGKARCVSRAERAKTKSQRSGRKHARQK